MFIDNYLDEKIMYMMLYIDKIMMEFLPFLLKNNINIHKMQFIHFKSKIYILFYMLIFILFLF